MGSGGGICRTTATPWRYDIQIDDVVDLSNDDALDKHGLQRPRPTKRQWPAFQHVGEALWKSGAKAILYESAAHPGNLALCVFAADNSIAGLQPIPPPELQPEPAGPQRGSLP